MHHPNCLEFFKKLGIDIEHMVCYTPYVQPFSFT